jgi:hypothetical protein
MYRREVVTVWANLAAANQASREGANGKHYRYLRALVPITHEGMVATDRRFGTNRHNPYLAPGGLAKLATGLETFTCDNQGNPSPPGQLAPPCKVQAPPSFQGRSTAYPQVRRER